MANSKRYRSIPVKLNKEEFNQFVLPHLTKGSRGPATKLSFLRLFNYILNLMHTGCQWEQLNIKKDRSGNAEIHYSRVFCTFKRWVKDGCFEKIFIGSVTTLFEKNLLDLDIIHGDGTTTAAKKGAIISGAMAIST